MFKASVQRDATESSNRSWAMVALPLGPADHRRSLMKPFTATTLVIAIAVAGCNRNEATPTAANTGNAVTMDPNEILFTTPTLNDAIPATLQGSTAPSDCIQLHEWRRLGKKRYAKLKRLLITADSGGSNDYRNRLWKYEPQRLANQTGMIIEVCHYPPGTSKWNKFEHRLFCHITRNWRGVPLESH